MSSFSVFIEDVKEIGVRYHIRLREDVIRPAGGGQAGDRGVLSVGNQRVTILDTITESGEVMLVTEEPLSENTKAQLDIDIEWRTSMMRNHTSEHIFVSILKKKYPQLEVGNIWIDGLHGNVELIGVTASFEEVFNAEGEVQRIIGLDIPVESKYVDADKIDPHVRAREGLAGKHEKLRVVSVGEFDSSACSGIHVESTGQIQFFKVVDIRHSEGNTRIEFVSGDGAISLTKELFNNVLLRKDSYPFEMEQIGAVLDKAKIAVEDKSQMIERFSNLLIEGPDIENVGEILFRYEYLPGFESKSLKNLANQFTFSETAVLLLFAPGTKSQIIFRTFSTPHEAKHYISEIIENLGGKGGGSVDSYTGGFVDVEDPKGLFQKIVSRIRKSLSKM